MYPLRAFQGISRKFNLKKDLQYCTKKVKHLNPCKRLCNLVPSSIGYKVSYLHQFSTFVQKMHFLDDIWEYMHNIWYKFCIMILKIYAETVSFSGAIWDEFSEH